MGVEQVTTSTTPNGYLFIQHEPGDKPELLGEVARFAISTRAAHRNFMEYKRILGRHPHDFDLFWSVIELQTGRHLWPRWAALLTFAIAGVAIWSG